MAWTRNWAALGALVTIVALLIDPFLQATVSLRGQNDQTGFLNSLPVANFVSLGKMLQDLKSGIVSVRIGPGSGPNDSMSPDMAYTMPDFGLTSAVYDGLNHAWQGQDAGAAKMVRFTCDTGNCTWPLYTTAAVCSRCNDVSRDIAKKRLQTTAFNRNGTDIFWAQIPNDFNVTLNLTSYDVAYAHIKQFNVPVGVNRFMYGDAVLLTASASTNYSESMSFRDMNTTIATVLIMRASDDFTHHNVSWEDSTPVATECGVYLCAKAYTATVLNGALQESEVGSWAIREPKSWRAADVAHHNIEESPIRLGRFDMTFPSFALSEKAATFRTDLQLVIPENELHGAVGENTVPTRFNISQSTIYSISMTIKSLFTNIKEDDDSYFMAVYPNLDPGSSSVISDIFWGSNDTQAATQNFSTIFEPLANQLTIQMREASNQSHTGQSDTFVLYFHVTWEFFLLLVITLGLGFVYFVGVLIQTVRLQLPAWKESAVPTLVYGLDDETQSLLRKIDSGRWSGQSMDQGAPEILTAARGMNRPQREKVRDSVVVGLQDGGGDGYTLQMGGLPR